MGTARANQSEKATPHARTGIRPSSTFPARRPTSHTPRQHPVATIPKPFPRPGTPARLRGAVSRFAAGLALALQGVLADTPPSPADGSDPTHWAFQPVRRPAIPGNAGTAGHPLDRLLDAARAGTGIEPLPPADARTLARRAAFDVTGLPPHPDEIPRLAGGDPDTAWAAYVDRLLASPRFGERWARHWLDVVRFAETHGFEMNNPRPNAWRYRDYVIRAFNTDLPYDRFVREQIAGDALGVDEATGFLVAGAWDQVKSPDEVLTRNQRADELHDIVSVTGSAFLALTTGCARCHDHKFDPIPQADYYALKAVFAGVQHGDREVRTGDRARIAAREAALRTELESVQSALAGFAPLARPGRLQVLDEEPPPTDPVARSHVEAFRPQSGRGEYPAGTGRGERDDPGDTRRSPTLTRNYLGWRDVPGADVFAWRPGRAGTFRVWASWGCGWETHARDARYVVDADGDPATRGDQHAIATVDQQRFADGSGDTPGRHLWSGFRDLGVHTFGPESRLLLRGGDGPEWVTTDLVVLEEVVAGEPAAPAVQPPLRSMVSARINEERIAPVTLTAVRFIIGATSGGEPCLDELEVFSADEPSRNLALASAGAAAEAGSSYAGNEFHRLEHLIDGRYGNRHSWISAEPGTGWVQVTLAQPARIDRIRWGRDREGAFGDRLPTAYRIEGRLADGTWHLLADSTDRRPWTTGRPVLPVVALDGADDAGRQRLEGLLRRRDELQREIAALPGPTQAYAGTFREPEPTPRLFRGDPMQPREPVAPGFLSDIGPADGRPDLDHATPEQRRRLALADWLTRPDHPLTARVIVNRIWQHYFGEGLVRTPSDFGLNGARPDHPELLDWLADELRTHGWSLKHIHRLILTSAAYRRASTGPADRMAIGRDRDADNRLLWRQAIRRLDAEPLRDAILAAAGVLDPRMGGPGWSPFEPNENYVRVYTPKQRFGPQDFRRMIYATVVRQRPDGVFGVFDCPDGGQIAPKRSRSTTPLQALNLLNSGFMEQAASAFAEHLQREAGGDPEAQVRVAFQRVFLRPPAAEELSRASDLVRAAGPVALARALLNANEFVHVF